MIEVEPLLCGPAVVPVIQLFIKKHGLKSYYKLVSLMKPEYQKDYLNHEEISTGKKYNEFSHVNMLETMEEHFYSDSSNSEWLEEYIDHQMDFGLNIFYRVAIRFINLKKNPVIFLTKCMKIWRQFHNTGNYYLIDGDLNYLVCELRDFACSKHEISRKAIMYAIKSAAKISNIKNIKCKYRYNEKENIIEYVYAW